MFEASTEVFPAKIQMKLFDIAGFAMLTLTTKK